MFYAGFNPSPPAFNNSKTDLTIDDFFEIPSDLTKVEIEWNYFLVWKGDNLFISGNFGAGDEMKPLIPSAGNQCRFIHALPDKECVTLVTASCKIWQYKVYENEWKEVQNFIPSNDENLREFVTKIGKNSSIVALTNLGRVFNVPHLVEMPKRVKFVDIACGFNHSILLADNGDVYSMGMGTRGQLGHGDLEDCDDPTLIEALAGLNVAQISAGAWHSAAITRDGDLYTWGWNTVGQLGTISDQKVVAVPTVIDFRTQKDKTVNLHIKKVSCGNDFTMCLSGEGTLWGCGSNKYGQMGQCRRELMNSKDFIPLKIDFGGKTIVDISCNGWGCVVEVE